MTPRQRYQQAHERWSAKTYPTAYADGHYSKPQFPIVARANGLTRAIQNYLTWSGHYANRINVQGRMDKQQQRQHESGNILTVKTFIPSTTKKGTADLHCIISGAHISIEIKIGRDHQSEAQIREQQRITSAGGVYVVIKTLEEFFTWYDSLVK